MTLTSQAIIRSTQHWLERLVIGQNFCPFARPVAEQQSIYYCVIENTDIESVLHRVIEECRRLDHSLDIETTLLILPNGFEKFDQFLDLIDIADRLLLEQGYEGTYQLAHFHPDYCFDGVDVDDAQNYTNRSPFPILHLLRESSIERALKSIKSPENIPQRNIRHAQKLGVQFFQQQLKLCREIIEE
jgi:hypothetical protein